jgi:folate-dependent phosphoribosylglycinamide formyltransferase PurN
MKAIIAQQRVALTAVDTFATVAERIHELEQAFSSYYRAHFKSKYIIVMERRTLIYTDGAQKEILEMAAVTAL